MVAGAPAGVAFADPAGPTDYRSTVVAVEPATPQITVGIVGGDSFVQLSVEPGTEVTVIGYYGEPYVRFLADGSVQQNRRSPTVAQNESRYGTADGVVGTAADIAATLPEWEVVGSDGSFVWHDHRAHLMSQDAPTGAHRGEQVADDVIPLQVNGVDVSVRVVTVWADAPSRAPLVAGAIVAAFAAMILLSVERRQAWLLAIAGAAACGIGWWQYDSLPPATGPSSTWFVLPGVAAASGIVALSFGRTLLSHALVLLGGLELAVWVYLRRDGMVRALLPTDAPFWLDRGVTAASGVAAVAAVLAGGIALFRLPGFAAPDPTPARKPAARKPAAKPRTKAGAVAGDVTTWGRKRK